MLKQGIHPEIVQNRLRNSSMEISLDIFNHIILGLQEAAVNGISEIFSKMKVHEINKP
jgi:integrase